MNRSSKRTWKAFALILLLTLVAFFILPKHTAFAEVDAPSSSSLTQSVDRALVQLAVGLKSADPKSAETCSALNTAIAELTTVIDMGRPSEPTLARLYFNRGLAQSQLGDYAASLLDFRRSDAAYPTSSAQRWIKIVRERIVASSLPDAGESGANPPQGSTDTPTSAAQSVIAVISPAIRSIPTTIRWWTAILAIALVWVSVAYGLIDRSMRSTGLRSFTAFALLVSIAALASVLVPSVRDPFARDVIVMASESTPRAGPDRVTYEPRPLEGQAVLRRGSELVVVEARTLQVSPGVPAWLRVQFKRATDSQLNSSRADAWIPASDVEWVSPASNGV